MFVHAQPISGVCQASATSALDCGGGGEEVGLEEVGGG